MKKKLIISNLITLVIVFSICFLYFNNKDNSKAVVNNEEYKEINNSSNFLTMMLETEAGSGEYALSNSGEWPGEGFTFNSELSKCENGGELSWNSNTNRVVMQSNKSDRLCIF